VNKDSNEPALIIGSSSVKQRSELSLLQLWDKHASFSSDDCAYTAEITSTCGDKSEARKQVCPGKLALHYLNSSRLLLQSDDESSDDESSDTTSSSVPQSYGRADSDTLFSTFPTSVCTRISESACAGVWRHRVYNSAKEEIGQSLIFVGGESWGIPSDRSIIGDLDQESVSTLLLAYKVSFETSSVVNSAAQPPFPFSWRLFGACRDMPPTRAAPPVGWRRSTAYAAHNVRNVALNLSALSCTYFIHMRSHYFFETAQLKPSFPLSPLPSYSA